MLMCALYPGVQHADKPAEENLKHRLAGFLSVTDPPAILNLTASGSADSSPSRRERREKQGTMFKWQNRWRCDSGWLAALLCTSPSMSGLQSGRIGTYMLYVPILCAEHTLKGSADYSSVCKLLGTHSTRCPRYE